MISPGSRLAILFASLIVSASGNLMAVDRPAAHRLSIVRLKFGESEKESWISAISNDKIDQLSLMVDQYDPKLFLHITAENGKSALMAACKQGRLDLVKNLVEAGADVNGQTLTQGTPFMFAVLGGHLDVARWLMEEQADIHSAGSNGWTAVTIASAKGYVDILAWLIEEGADAQVRDVYRYTPLLRAVSNGFEDVTTLLLSLPETDVNAQDEYENTSLHHAVSMKNHSMIKLLLSHGADPSLVNRAGLSPYVMAGELRHLFDVAEPVREKALTR